MMIKDLTIKELIKQGDSVPLNPAILFKLIQALSYPVNSFRDFVEVVESDAALFTVFPRKLRRLNMRLPLSARSNCMIWQLPPSSGINSKGSRKAGLTWIHFRGTVLLAD